MDSHSAKLYVKTTTYMDTTYIFQFLTNFAHNFTISPQNGINQLGIIADIFM